MGIWKGNWNKKKKKQYNTTWPSVAIFGPFPPIHARVRGPTCDDPVRSPTCGAPGSTAGRIPLSARVTAAWARVVRASSPIESRRRPPHAVDKSPRDITLV
jgi:hypothetical protein